MAARDPNLSSPTPCARATAAGEDVLVSGDRRILAWWRDSEESYTCPSRVRRRVGPRLAHQDEGVAEIGEEIAVARPSFGGESRCDDSDEFVASDL